MQEWQQGGMLEQRQSMKQKEWEEELLAKMEV